MNTPVKSLMHFNHTTVPDPDTPRNKLHNQFFGIIDRARHVEVWRPEEESLQGVNQYIFNGVFRETWFDKLTPGEAMAVVGLSWHYSHSGMKSPALRLAHNGNPALAVVKCLDTQMQSYLLFIGKTSSRERYVVYSWYPHEGHFADLKRWDQNEWEIAQLMQVTEMITKMWAETRSPYITLAANKLPTGQVVSLWRPNRHHNVNWYALDKLKATERMNSRATLGFVDQFGTFYNRVDAWNIAVANDQIVRDKVFYGNSKGQGQLFSEHLY